MAIKHRKKPMAKHHKKLVQREHQALAIYSLEHGYAEAAKKLGTTRQRARYPSLIYLH